MKKICILYCLLLVTVTSFSQPDWSKKATKSVFTLKTFAADGSLIASTNGFFTNANGEAVSTYSPFKGASRAIIIDSQGKEFQVTGILGANDMYDVVKFRVNNNKCQPLTISSTIGSVGSNVWLLPYHEINNLKNGSIRRAETIFDKYAYYTVSMTISDNMVSCPLLNENGEVLGIFPEGTINRTDKKLMPFKYGAVSFAKKTGAYIVPFAIVGSYNVFKRSIKQIYGKPYKVVGDLEAENKKLMKKVENLIKKGCEQDE